MTPGAKTSRCRSCGAPIIWAMTENGKRMPVDAEPTLDGNIQLFDKKQNVGPSVIARVHSDLRPGRYKSHFATCPDAAKHRKRKEPVA